MIIDGKPEHWPRMVTQGGEDTEQNAIKALAQVRKMIVDYRKDECDEDWRVAHAQSDHIVNVVGRLIADAQATEKH